MKNQQPIQEDRILQCDSCFSMQPMKFIDTVQLSSEYVEDCYWCEVCGADTQIERLAEEWEQE